MPREIERDIRIMTLLEECYTELTTLTDVPQDEVRTRLEHFKLRTAELERLQPTPDEISRVLRYIAVRLLRAEGKIDVYKM